MDEATVVIDAPAPAIWELVTDVTRMGRWSPEARGARWFGGARGPAVGARFVGFNRHGLVWWATRCTVVECDEPHRFAFQVAESGMTWGWRLEPVDGGTSVTEWRDQTRSTNVLIKAVQRSGIIGRDRERLMVDGMHRTLGAVKAYLEGAAAA
ncbi:SRPBCC family protein [Pseudonocardia sp. CA-107938]|uniref:SRPBCC family protein n=1 Tax=Pseudonocardia sp. CA-107938 TaxID=3240021 RepID=UPI003D907D7D